MLLVGVGVSRGGVIHDSSFLAYTGGRHFGSDGVWMKWLMCIWRYLAGDLGFAFCRNTRYPCYTQLLELDEASMNT